jgi:hypothetical protein
METSEANGTPYTETERRIYRYRVGADERRADPIALVRRIHHAQRELQVDIIEASREIAKLHEAQDQGVELTPHMSGMLYDAMHEIARVALHAFGVPSAEEDEAGWTESEAMAAFNDFYAWMAAVREDFPNTPSSAVSPTSDSTGSDPEAAASPTAPSSASGPTPTA